MIMCVFVLCIVGVLCMCRGSSMRSLLISLVACGVTLCKAAGCNESYSSVLLCGMNYLVSGAHGN